MPSCTFKSNIGTSKRCASLAGRCKLAHSLTRAGNAAREQHRATAPNVRRSRSLDAGSRVRCAVLPVATCRQTRLTSPLTVDLALSLLCINRSDMLQSIDQNVAASVAATSESYRQLVRAEAHANAYRKVREARGATRRTHARIGSGTNNCLDCGASWTRSVVVVLLLL